MVIYNLKFYTYFFNYHRRGYGEQLSGMSLPWVVIKNEENYLRAIAWKSFIWGSLARGNFPGDNYLTKNFRSQKPNQFQLIKTNYLGRAIAGEATFWGQLSGRNYPGGPLSRGQLSWGQLSRGNCPGGNCSRGNYPGGKCPGGNCPVPIFKCWSEIWSLSIIWSEKASIMCFLYSFPCQIEYYHFQTLHKKMKLSVKDFFNKCDQIRRKLRI